MKTIEQKSFYNFDEFRDYARMVRLLFFHVFSGMPDPHVDGVLSCGPNEALVLLDVLEDRGFLQENTVDIDTASGPVVSKKLVATRGLGAWSSGTAVAFTEDPAQFDKIIGKGRRFLFALEAQLSTRRDNGNGFPEPATKCSELESPRANSVRKRAHLRFPHRDDPDSAHPASPS